MSAPLRDRLRAGEATLGTFLNLGSPLAAEACALAGFDWLLVDLEHGAGGEDALVGQLLAAAAHDVPVIVRVETAERIRAGRVLDSGAAGVMFPRLDTRAEVIEALAHLRFPPEGDRGVATYNRACGFGLRDLTHALGVPGQIDAREYRAALDRVAAAARSAGVTAGVLASDR